jgi:hypothetical protein
MRPTWQHRQQVILQQVVRPDELNAHIKCTAAQAQAGYKVVRVYFKVLKQGTAWRWLQVRGGCSVSSIRPCQPRLDLAEL